MPRFDAAGLFFVHIPKNAGRSVEAALMGAPDPAARGARRPLGRIGTALSRLAAPALPRTHLMGTLDVALAAQHLTYAEVEILGLLPPERRHPDDTFCVVRDPFDRAVSSVTHTCGPQKDPAGFERALERWLEAEPSDHNRRAHRRPQAHYLTDRAGRRAVGHVLRFERLAEEFAALMARRGLAARLPWHGRSRAPGTARALYTARARTLVETAFAEDIDAFGYRFA